LAADLNKSPDASFELDYLDPPFNSNLDYNVLLCKTSGKASQAKFHAADDTFTSNLKNLNH